jgi:hypothetical protein
MNPLKLASALAAVALLGACHVRVTDNEAGNATVDISAPGNAQDGRISIQAPGFNLSMDVPEDIRGEIRADDSDFVYPGSSIGGVHVAAGNRGPDSGRVEIGFSTDDGPDRVVAWYRDTARGADMRVESTRQEGDGFVISGTRRDDDRFTVTVHPRPGGGTDGQLILTDSPR